MISEQEYEQLKNRNTAKVVQTVLPGQKHVSFANRGGEFEADLDSTHFYYKTCRMAKVEKNPVEWCYTNKGTYDYLKATNSDVAAVTVTGKFIKKQKSDVDYSGVAMGKHIEFDAKQTKGKSLPFGNIERHQIENLHLTEKIGGIAGLMIFFSELNRVFFASASFVAKRIDEMIFENGRKSLSLADLEENALEIPIQNNLVDWFQVLIK